MEKRIPEFEDLMRYLSFDGNVPWFLSSGRSKDNLFSVFSDRKSEVVKDEDIDQ